MQVKNSFIPPGKLHIKNGRGLASLGDEETTGNSGNDFPDFSTWIKSQSSTVQEEFAKFQNANPSNFGIPSTISKTINGIPEWAIMAGVGLLGMIVLFPRK